MCSFVHARRGRKPRLANSTAIDCSLCRAGHERCRAPLIERHRRIPSGSTSTCSPTSWPTACERGDRTGTGTLGVFGRQMRFDLAQGFPLLTTKKLHFKSIARRAAVVPARRHQCALAAGARRHASGTSGPTPNGELGPVYGKQWRSWTAPDGRVIDQIAAVRALDPREPRQPPAHRHAPGTRPRSTTWRCRPATACSSSSSPRAGCPASSTSARPTSSSACRSTSPATRC